MDFQYFLNYVPKFVEVVLPADESHYKMAPQERIDTLNDLENKNKNPKTAAVMMLFYPKKGRTHLVLIVRNSYKGIHSAQIAFPGGKYEIEDLNYENTALRETYEEIGVSPDFMEIVKSFTHIYIPPSNFMVYPFMGICQEEIIFTPDSNEVAKIIELPMSVLLDDTLIVNVKISTSYGINCVVPAFKIEEHIVWGATAMMLSELKDVLKKVL
jgi:8-oxo-dGTP pyrophosphatase MutT (NUDIX family)